MKRNLSLLLAVALMLSIFGGLVLFNANAAGDDRYVFTTLPGIQNWTADNIDVYNSINAGSYINSPGVISDKNLVGAAAKSLCLTGGSGLPSANNYLFSTRASTDTSSMHMNGNVFGDYGGAESLRKYLGLRIAVADENGNEPTLGSAGYVAFKLYAYSTGSWNNVSIPLYEVTYRVSDNSIEYLDGYYYIRFADMNRGWPDGNGIKQCDFLQRTGDTNYRNMQLIIYGTNINTAGSDSLYISDMQLFAEPTPPDKTGLVSLIEEVTGLDTGAAYTSELAAAQAVVDDDNATQDAIDAQISILTRIKITINNNNMLTTVYFDGVSMPGFQDWTAEDCTLHNGCVTQSTISLSTDGLIGNAEQSLKAVNRTANEFNISNCNDGATTNAEPTIGDPFINHAPTFGQYKGMRVAVTDKNGLMPVFPADTTVVFKLYGDYNSGGPVPTFTVTYNLGDIIYNDGYIHLCFTDMLPAWSSSRNFAEIVYQSWWTRYRLFNISINGTNIGPLNGGELYFSDFQLYTQNTVIPRDELIELIAQVTELDIQNAYAAEIAQAQTVCDNIRATQAEINDAMDLLNEVITDISSASGGFNPANIVSSFGAVADPSLGDISDSEVKILMIGNSFSWNAFTYLKQIAAATDINLTAANLYYSGCNLSQHDTYFTNNSAVYSYDSTWKSNQGNYTISQALADQDWDYISIQQVSGKAGRYDTYQPYLHNVVSYLRENEPDAEIVWHQTWAYASDSDHSDFPFFQNNQSIMWQAIESTSKQAAEAEGIKYIIPSGKAFQNARATAIGDNLCSDGYHANEMGRYLAGYCFFSTLTGQLPSALSYTPSNFTQDEAALLRRAIIDAVAEYGYVQYHDNAYTAALDKFNSTARNGLDGIAVCGNIASGTTAGLNTFKAINSDYLDTDNGVMFVLGDDDLTLHSRAAFIYSSLMTSYYANDFEPIAQKRRGNRHMVLGQTHVLGIMHEGSENGFATYEDVDLEWLSTELAAAHEASNGMPIFLLTAHPVSWTAGGAGASRICEILNNYPELIVLSGGSTVSISNESSIYQQDFTAVNVGSLSASVGGASEGLLIEVDSAGAVRLRRYNLTTNGEYFDSWTIPAPDLTDKTHLEKYTVGVYTQPVINMTDGDEFDLTEVESVIPTWLPDGAPATLNGEPYAYGTPITAAGEYTLSVSAGTLNSTVSFTVIDVVFEQPVVEVIEDGAEYDLYTTQPPFATWTPEGATATLNGEPYTAGTAITAVGSYVLVVTNGDKTATVNFTVIDTTPLFTPGDVDDDDAVSVSDALICLRAAVGLTTLEGTSFSAADMDEDGEITVADALQILRISVDLI